MEMSAAVCVQTHPPGIRRASFSFFSSSTACTSCVSCLQAQHSSHAACVSTLGSGVCCGAEGDDLRRLRRAEGGGSVTDASADAAGSPLQLLQLGGCSGLVGCCCGTLGLPDALGRGPWGGYDHVAGITPPTAGQAHSHGSACLLPVLLHYHAADSQKQRLLVLKSRVWLGSRSQMLSQM